MTKVTFNNKDSIFYDSVKKSVEDYFIQKKISSTGNFALYLKALMLFPAAFIIYLFLLIGNYPAFAGILLSGLLGFVLASIGFNVMHDACHGSYSSKKWVNYIMGFSLNCLGGNSFIWKQKHNIVHHTYTNVDGIDDDIAKMPVIRQCSSQKWVPAHRYQHIYSILVYALSSFLWVFLMDFTKYFGKKIYRTRLQNFDLQEHIIFWLTKVFYILFYVVIPIYFVGVLPWLCGFFAMHFVKGFTLAMVFQLAHVVEDTHFVDATEQSQKINEEWAVHQVRTTANFATENKFINWFVGGLNFQIEHHLFPRVSHVHYPALSLLVQKCCNDYGIRYINYPTLGAAINSHFRFMKQLGKKSEKLAIN